MKNWESKEIFVVRELGRTFLSEGRDQLARRVFSGLIAIDAKDSYAHAGLGIACANLREFGAADKALSEAIRLDPLNWTAAIHLTELRLRQGKSPAAKDAAQFAERATRSDHCPRPARQRAEVLVRLCLGG